MSISFSGLASGLDTSSWIKSLTALKQAKVTTLEEKKSGVQLQLDTFCLGSYILFFQIERNQPGSTNTTQIIIVIVTKFQMDISVFFNVFIQRIHSIFRTFHQTDAMLCVRFRRQILHEDDIHITATNSDVAFKNINRIIAVFFFVFIRQSFHTLCQGMPNSFYLYSMVIFAIVVGERIEHGYQTLSVYRFVPAHIGVDGP